MDTFSYLSVLFSVIVGLAVTEILQGLRRLIVVRKQVTVYAPLLIWMGVVLLILIQDWWAMFGLSAVKTWTFAMYAVVLVLVTLLYLVAGLSVPETEPDGTIDMRRSYFLHSRWFFGLFAAAVLASLAKGYVFYPHVVLDGNFAFHILFLAAAIAGSATRADWFHRALAPVIAGAFVVYIGLFFTRL
jgi:hypothetical protein